MDSTLAILEIKDPGNLQYTIITIKGVDGTIAAGANGIPGRLLLRDKDGRETIALNGQTGEVIQRGDIILKDNNGNERVLISGQSAEIIIKTAAGVPLVSLGKGGNLELGGGNEAGDIFVKNKDGKDIIWLSGETGEIHVGANDKAGHLLVQDKDAFVKIDLDGASGDATISGTVKIEQNLLVSEKTTTKDLTVNRNVKFELGDLTLGGEAHHNGFLHVNDANGQNRIYLDGKNGDLFVKNAAGLATIHLNGRTGDILLENADCAEDFDVCETESVEPGTVMVLGEQGVLHQSQQAYDKRVAGVVSGAGNYKPGLILDKQRSRNNRKPIALLGKVYCKVDASYAPIEVGDLLTTSNTPGHAMKAIDPLSAFGAVLGKALRPLKEGQCLIPILISLQ